MGMSVSHSDAWPIPAVDGLQDTCRASKLPEYPSESQPGCSAYFNLLPVPRHSSSRGPREADSLVLDA
jgi:hypothetical protein